MAKKYEQSLSKEKYHEAYKFYYAKDYKQAIIHYNRAIHW
jgi:hypothetical protein